MYKNPNYFWSLGDEQKLWQYVEQVGGLEEAYAKFVEAFYQHKKTDLALFKISKGLNKIVKKIEQQNI